MPALRVPAPLKFYLDNQSKIVLKGETVRENLTSESGEALRKKCSVEVDAGNIKQKLQTPQVELATFGEDQYPVGLMCITHNMQKTGELIPPVFCFSLFSPSRGHL
jgi:hypothetical protein